MGMKCLHQQLPEVMVQLTGSPLRSSRTHRSARFEYVLLLNVNGLTVVVRRPVLLKVRPVAGPVIVRPEKDSCWNRVVVPEATLQPFCQPPSAGVTVTLELRLSASLRASVSIDHTS